MSDIDLWLDDMRPAPDGWTLAKTADEAKALLLTGRVRNASLDHDLGACDGCLRAMAPLSATPEEWLAKTNYESMPHCDHFGSGYTLVCWMEETGNWPRNCPKVHSANPAGRERMMLAIHREWERGRWTPEKKK